MSQLHSAERERLILAALEPHGFISCRILESRLTASAATIRRDLARLELAGKLERVHGGARLPVAPPQHLQGTPFDQAIALNLAAKQAIGKAAAALCRPGEGVMIDGGTTTLQMCPHLAGLDLQVLTNSLHVVSALLPQPGTRILLPSGSVFREQNIVLAAAGEDSMPRFHAPKLFMGAAAIGADGIMQADVVLVAAERRLIDRAEQVIVLADSSKFTASSGVIVCGLGEVDVVITDRGLPQSAAAMLKAAGVEVVLAD